MSHDKIEKAKNEIKNMKHKCAGINKILLGD
jgi:hypothetical protein